MMPTYYIHVIANNTRDGNPRRVFLVYQAGERVAIFDEDYNGHDELRRAFPDARKLDTLYTTVEGYKRLTAQARA